MVRRNAVLDFFDAFNKGYDTTGRVLQDVEMGRVANAKPEDIVQADQSNAGPMPDGSALSQHQAAGPDVRTGVKFLGQTYNEPLSESQLANARMRAMADVVSRNDPVAGLRMRREITQGERDDVRFEREGKRFDQEQVEAGLRTRGLQRADRAGARVESVQSVMDKAAGLSDDDLTQFAGQANKYGHIPLLYTGRTKGGYSFLTTDANGQPGKPLTFNSAQLRQIATATELANAGYGAESMQMFNTVSKELADMVAQMNGVTGQTVNSRNQALHMERTDANNAARLGIEGRRLGLAREQNDRTKWVPEQYVDAQGNVRTFDVNRTSPGKPQMVERQMPAGLRPYVPKDNALKVNQDGSVVKDGKLYLPDPKTGQYREAVGLGTRVTDVKFAEYVKENGGGGEEENKLRPFTQADMADERKALDLDRYERRPTRGLFARRGEYEYFDPATGDTLSLPEYRRLMGVQAKLETARAASRRSE